MPRRKYRKNDDPDIFGAITGISFIILGFVYFVWSKYENAIRMYTPIALTIAVCVLILVVYLVFHRYKNKKQRMTEIAARVQEDTYKDLFSNFINRFDKEGKKLGWKYRGHSFDYKRLEDFHDTLIQNGLNLKKDTLDELFPLLQTFIDTYEIKYTQNTIQNHSSHTIADLSKRGDDFENLIVRLYDTMGYTSKRTGGTGDQGADVIAAKEGEVIVIQAKCYTNSVGNDAVQQAWGALKMYSGTRAVVVTTSSFTHGAYDLAKATNVELIDGERLKHMLAEYLQENWQ